MRRSQEGFSLIEMVVFIIVLGVGIAGTLAALVQVTRESADPLVHLRAAELGQSYLEEIAAVPYKAPPGIAEPCPADQRRDWAELECYDGVEDEPPQNALGEAVDGYAGYRVTVSVAEKKKWEKATGRWVTVTVHPPGSSAIRFDQFRGETP